LAATGGCSRGEHSAPPAPPAAHLSTRNPDANIGAVVQFVRAACIESITDPGAIEQAIAATRWPVEEDAGSAGQMVTVRDLEHGRIAYSAIPFEAPGGRFHDCQLELDGAVAPGLDRMRAALAAILPVAPGAAAPGASVWRWQPETTREFELELSARPPARGETKPGLSIHVASTVYTLPPSPAPTANEAIDGNLDSTAPESAAPAEPDPVAPQATPDSGNEPPPPPAHRWGNSAAPQ